MKEVRYKAPVGLTKNAVAFVLELRAYVTYYQAMRRGRLADFDHPYPKPRYVPSIIQRELERRHRSSLPLEAPLELPITAAKNLYWHQGLARIHVFARKVCSSFEFGPFEDLWTTDPYHGAFPDRAELINWAAAPGTVNAKLRGAFVWNEGSTPQPHDSFAVKPPRQYVSFPFPIPTDWTKLEPIPEYLIPDNPLDVCDP